MINRKKSIVEKIKMLYKSENKRQKMDEMDDKNDNKKLTKRARLEGTSIKAEIGLKVGSNDVITEDENGPRVGNLSDQVSELSKVNTLNQVLTQLTQ